MLRIIAGDVYFLRCKFLKTIAKGSFLKTNSMNLNGLHSSYCYWNSGRIYHSGLSIVALFSPFGMNLVVQGYTTKLTNTFGASAETRFVINSEGQPCHKLFVGKIHNYAGCDLCRGSAYWTAVTFSVFSTLLCGCLTLDVII